MSSELLNADGQEASEDARNLAIRVIDLSKRYQIYDKPRHRLLQSILRDRRQLYREFWALHNVSFGVAKGETVGVIGRNGSGKSTLLQIICGTLAPTSGSVDVSGRVSALLELGAGFNPDFSGRENAYMNAALLGLKREEIDARFAEIETFADIGDFIDQPIKTYSSGMYVRLAFAVAINVSPDILVIDEALSVGDMAFQAKCMAHIRMMMESGVTVLFVSHDIGAVKALCNRCLYLEGGRVREWGKTADVAGIYIANSHLEVNRALTSSERLRSAGNVVSNPEANMGAASKDRSFLVSTSGPVAFGSEPRRYGDGRVSILDVKLLDSAGGEAVQMELDAPFEIQISVRANDNLPDIAWGYSIRDLKGQMLVGMMSTSNAAIGPLPIKAGETLVLAIKGLNSLQPGVYTIAIGIELPIIINRQHVFLEVVENAAIFRSVPPADPRRLSPGLVKVPVDFQLLGSLPPHVR